jgi:KAP-like P-loop domain-containing protein
MTQAFDPRDRSGYESVSAAEHVPASENVPAPGPVPAPMPRTSSVEGLLSRYRDEGPVTAGVIVDRLLESHDYYVADDVIPESVAALGPRRTVAEHVDVAQRRWDCGQFAKFRGRHLLLALALDAEVGWPLLRSGVIASILMRWQPGPPKEGHRLAWDVLSHQGRELAEEQPLLAAAFGAPPEWTAELPAPVTVLALSPAADRIAALADGTVYEAADGSLPRRVNDVDGKVASLGWGKDGLVGLRITGSSAEVTQIATRSGLRTTTDVTGGRLSDDGLLVWLEQSHGVVRSWSGGRAQENVAMTPPGTVLAVDGTGRRGLVDVAGEAVLVSTLSEDEGFALAPGTSPGPPPNWPSDKAKVLGVGDPPHGPCALVALGKRAAVASAVRAGEVVIGGLSSPPVARVATGPGAITALAAGSAGRTLAVAIGHRVSVWPLGKARPAARSIPGYDSDSLADADLLEADRDAFALAALIASRELRPPLAIGLFGDWGSGKTFVLDRIDAMLTKLTGNGASDGYLKHVHVIPFNAWHYAETNLWASLVDQVIRKIDEIRSGKPAPDVPTPPEVADAKSLADNAEAEADRLVKELDQAKCDVRNAQDEFVRQRHTAWALGIVVLLLAGAAAFLAALGQSRQIVAVASVAAALFGSVAAAAVQYNRVSDQAKDIVEAGRAGLGVLSRVGGRTAAMAAQAAVMTERKLDAEQKAANEKAARLREEANHAEDRAKDDVVGTVLGQLSSVTEYREQLSLVARTRDRFDKLNKVIAQAEDADRERFVIAIDDLDRCAAENVVKVLEAVHLLFNFEMFVVVLAVDTRWLAQSLQIRYRQLLGKADTARPYDYLEKIIQIPVHLLPLDEALVRTMITGLTGLPLAPPPEPVPPPAPPRPPDSKSGEDGGGPTGDGTDGVLGERHDRAARAPLPAQMLKITQEEATAMSAVAPLVGTTPRTVKRFVNTYRLLKARADDPAEFGHPQGSIGDHEVVAFLLAVVTGRPAVYRRLLAALACAPDSATLQTVTAALNAANGVDPALAGVLTWLSGYPRYARAPAHRYAKWATEVARFSFTPTTADDVRAAVSAPKAATPSSRTPREDGNAGST